jgi:hypothetical protein
MPVSGVLAVAALFVALVFVGAIAANRRARFARPE